MPISLLLRSLAHDKAVVYYDRNNLISETRSLSPDITAASDFVSNLVDYVTIVDSANTERLQRDSGSCRRNNDTKV